MGGNAARERRRLSRLDQTELKVSKVGKPAEKSKAHSTPKPKAKTPTKDYSQQKSPAAQSKSYGGSNTVKSQHKIPVTKKSNAFTSDSKFKVDTGKSAKERKLPKGEHPPSKQTKFKKPKHLARKMNDADNPAEMEELLKRKEELDVKKAERSKRFKAKVIDAVGGKKFFDEETFNSIMEGDGGCLDFIVKAVKLSADGKKKERSAETRSVPIKSEPAEIPVDKIEKATATAESNVKPEPEPKEIPVDDTVKATATAKSNVKPKPEEIPVDNTEKATENTDDEDMDSMEASAENNDDVDAKKVTDKGSASSDDDSSDSSDDEDDAAQKNERSRGRKRKGREDADAKREELNTKQQEEAQRIADANAPKKTSRADDKRRCIGRKPVTDFEVWKMYTGTVRYVKPTLGIFIDIGCHTDAFCHISRASDEFVDRLTDAHYKSGDVLENKVRIIDIDRTKKRITASLQSDERVAHEEKSAREYKERSKEKPPKREKFGINNESPARQATKVQFNDPVEPPQEPQEEEVPIIIDPDNMTPADLKRARKLQRRAERRKEQELTGIAA